MTDRFVTAFHPEGFKQYGHRLVESYEKFGPDMFMYVYASEYEANCKPVNKNGCYEPLNNSEMCIPFEQFGIKELCMFLDRHSDNKHVHGRHPDGNWKEKDFRAGYNYRFDMYKFCRMIYVMWAEAHRDPTGRMVWLDGDCVLRKQLPDDFIDRALPNGEAYAYLGRGNKYSETGFLVFDLPKALPILDEWANFCTSDSFLEQKEQHSAYLFDRARERHPDIKGHDLTPGGGGHPIYNCYVGEYAWHMKGARKDKGVCPQGLQHEQRLKRKGK